MQLLESQMCQSQWDCWDLPGFLLFKVRCFFFCNPGFSWGTLQTFPFFTLGLGSYSHRSSIQKPCSTSLKLCMIFSGRERTQWYYHCLLLPLFMYEETSLGQDVIKSIWNMTYKFSHCWIKPKFSSTVFSSSCYKYKLWLDTRTSWMH